MKISLILLLNVIILTGCGTGKTDRQNNSNKLQQDSSEVAEADTLITREFTEKADTTGLITKTGALNYSGNEPFVKPTLFVSGNESYQLVADEKFMKETFKTINGRNATIYGKEKDVGNRTMLEVHYYEILEDNR